MEKNRASRNRHYTSNWLLTAAPKEHSYKCKVFSTNDARRT